MGLLDDSLLFLPINITKFNVQDQCGLERMATYVLVAMSAVLKADEHYWAVW